ncbi:MAG: PspA/IM30 family protein, partial [Polyangiaceae bacterium]|nr:PspA/IM30 family protein [Polyangiaceae bacterium]
LLDAAEDDRKLVDFNIEEMDSQLKEAQRDVLSAVASEKTLKKKVDEAVAEAEKWEKRAELALKTNDEPLAREALRQKQQARTQADLTEKARIEQRDTALRMKGEFDRMKTKLEEIKLRKGTIVAKAQQARAGADGLGAKGGSSAFNKFREMEERVEGREAQASALNEVEEALGGGVSAMDAEARFRELEANAGGRGKTETPEIDAEIAALREKIRIKP